SGMGAPGDLHSFPTRRSSDLVRVPDPNALETFERSRPGDAAEGHWPDFYRRLLEIRHRHLVPRLHGSRQAGVRILQDKALCATRSEEHTSELQSRENLVCRLL